VRFVDGRTLGAKPGVLNACDKRAEVKLRRSLGGLADSTPPVPGRVEFVLIEAVAAED
jgi:hypothetical protein